MQDQLRIRSIVFTLLLTVMPLHAQSQPTLAPPASTLPATPPTMTPPAPEVPLTPAQSPPKRATISYTGDQLTVTASNSSLNQILREVARQTGIKITGGVAEERVFGDYGPGLPAEVLGKLLDGTASNVLFVANTGDQPAELILTPRTGGPSPPNPNAARFDDNADDDSQRLPLPPEAQTQTSPASQSTPATPGPASPPPPVAPPAAVGEGLQPQQPSQPASATDNNQQSPNGVKTPQQIYDELMRLRNQQQSQPH